MSQSSYKKYGLQEIRKLVEQGTEEDQKVYSQNVELECSSDAIYYVGQKLKVDCTIQNTGNVVLKNLEVCLEEDCSKTEITIGQRKDLVFSRALNIAGPHDLAVVARNTEVSKTTNIEFEVWDRPDIKISEVSYPSNIDLSKKFKIEFKLSPLTSSVPHNVKVNLVSDSFEKQWSLAELEQDRRYILNVEEYALSDIDNRFRILVNYEDKMGRQFSSTDEFTISLSEVSIKERMILLLNKINVDLKYDFLIIAVALFVAGIVVGLIFRSRRSYE